MKIIFFDTETTGNTDDARLCQLAIKERGVLAPILNATYHPPVPISVEPMAIHHITPKMVQGRPPFVDAPVNAEIKALSERDEVLAVAHTAAFVLGMLAREVIVPHATICTCKKANHFDHSDLVEIYRYQ